MEKIVIQNGFISSKRIEINWEANVELETNLFLFTKIYSRFKFNDILINLSIESASFFCLNINHIIYWLNLNKTPHYIDCCVIILDQKHIINANKAQSKTAKKKTVYLPRKNQYILFGPVIFASSS